jgi:hypothetical protein
MLTSTVRVGRVTQEGAKIFKRFERIRVLGGQGPAKPFGQPDSPRPAEDQRRVIEAAGPLHDMEEHTPGLYVKK